MPPVSLSKTKVLQFCQCPRKLWLDQYSPELEEESAAAQARFETGRLVGAVARRVYGRDGGHRVDNERGLRAAIAETDALLAAGGSEPIFEATFDQDGLTVQVDVYDRSGTAPRIVEVKSSTSVKPHHLVDCAVQAYALAELGRPASTVSVAHIDSDFVYAGDGDYTGLFAESDVTDAIAEPLAAAPGNVAAAREVLERLDEPDVAVGAQCTSPHPCPFYAHCVPTQGEYPVGALGGDRERIHAWINSGLTDLRDVPEDDLANDVQRMIQRQTRLGEPLVDPALKTFADALAYPRYYLDFETISFAVPIWAATRPYQALPFQWSCHIETAPGEIEHREFLDLSADAPMRTCAETLIEALGPAGPILVYTGYENRVIDELIDRFADLAAPLTAMRERLVDLYPVAKRHYYHPAMRGSWSIKAVLPTVAPDLDYGTLEVRDGMAAQAAYLEAIRHETSDERRAALRDELAAYCRLDSLALVRLVEFFAGSA